MLKKKVCQHCISSGNHPSRLRRWFDLDEGNWNAGYVTCPYLQKSWSGTTMVYKMALKKEVPPEWCSYVLEHIILNQSLPEIDKVERIDSTGQKKFK